MRIANLTALTVLLLTPHFLQAQATTAKPAGAASKPASTKLDAFLSRKGVIVVRDLHTAGILTVERRGDAETGTEISKVIPNDQELTDEITRAGGISGWVDITAVAAYNPGNDENKFKGLHCDVYQSGGAGASDSNASTVDIEEAQNLSKGLQYLLDLSKKWAGKDVGQKEAVFSTLGDLQIQFSQDGAKKPEVSIRSGTIGAATLHLAGPDDLGKLKQIVDDGIAWLNKQ